MRQTRLAASLIVVLTASFAGCSKHATEPPPVAGPGVPRLIATEPPVRAPLVIYDSGIWGQFDLDLDPATIHTQSVFLKLDGQRIPITVSYEAGARKIHVTPVSTLTLQRTYTVEFTPTVHSAEGVPLAQNVFYQFTTNSLRRIVYDAPSQDELAGPVTMLAWGGSQAPVDNVRYEVYAGTDSAQVAARAIAPLQSHVFTRYLPSGTWPRGSRIFWAVTSENLTTHERMNGDLMRFDVAGTDLPEQTVLLRGRDHGSKNTTQNIQYCALDSIPCGGTFNGAIRWSMNGLPSDARVVSATIVLIGTRKDQFPATQPTLWMSQNDWQPCAIVAPGPPYAEPSGLLAGSTPVDTSGVEFTSDRLAAFFEAQLHGDIYTFGTLIHPNTRVAYWSTSAGNLDLRPFARVTYVRPGPAPSPARPPWQNATHAKPSTSIAAPGTRVLTAR